MDRYGLSNWAVVSDYNDDPYKAPEQRRACLKGQTVDHPRRQDGNKVITSPIKECVGLNILTESGSLITLVGPPDEEFATWCAERGRPIDPQNPIRFVEEQLGSVH